MLRHALSNRFTDTFGRAGDDGFAGEVEKFASVFLFVGWWSASVRADRTLDDRLLRPAIGVAWRRTDKPLSVLAGPEDGSAPALQEGDAGGGTDSTTPPQDRTEDVLGADQIAKGPPLSAKYDPMINCARWVGQIEIGGPERDRSATCRRRLAGRAGPKRVFLDILSVAAGKSAANDSAAR